MFFEGSEKKFEISLRPGAPSLRGFGEPYWRELVQIAKANVLSQISSPQCDAYLLSESSLFVWDDQVTMITCGRTELVHAILHLLKRVDLETIETLFFERKNEYFPQHQRTDFFDDLKLLNERMPGKAHRLGNSDEHHLYLYNLDRPYKPVPNDFTFEMLMYNIQGPAKSAFVCHGQGPQSARASTGIDSLLEGFTVDDHLFTPCGYSLNALRGRDYYTIHVTPQEEGSYASFETNVRSGPELTQAVERILEIFQPMSFDLVTFNTEAGNRFPTLKGYTRKTLVRQNLTCGYELQFSYHYRPVTRIQAAQPVEELKLSHEV